MNSETEQQKEAEQTSTLSNLLKDVEFLEKKDFEGARLILLDLVHSKTDKVTEQLIINAISEKTQINEEVLQKAFKEENKKNKTYSSTTSQLIIDGMLDKKKLAEKLHEQLPFFYDNSKIWWFWNEEEKKYEQKDETDLLNNVGSRSSIDTIGSKTKNEIIESLKQIGRLKIPAPTPKNWVQFKDQYIDLSSPFLTEKEFILKKINAEYFFTNPIPWNIGPSPKTPVLDKLFTEWVGEDYKQDLYELMAYCCYSSYPIQVLICLWGGGRNGKSQFLKILDKFIGKENVTSTELDLLASNRFESFKLYKKLVCTIGETNFGILNNTSLVKKLTGGDKIGFEKKNKDPFDDYSYAKMIIASNSLPSSEDTSDGFYRRWHVIDFPNEFADNGKEIWETVPDEEYEALACKVCIILPELLKRGMFSHQGSIDFRKKKYISISNPLSLFIKDYCVTGDELFVSYNKLYTDYVKYLQQNKRRKVKLREFRSALEDEGFYIDKTSKKMDTDEFGNSVYKSGYFVMGLDLKIVRGKDEQTTFFS